MDSALNKSTSDLPEILSGQVNTWLEKTADQPDIAAVIAADASIESMLLKVVACSAYAADVLERQPGSLRALIESGRLQRPMADGELLQWFADETAHCTSETELEKKLRLLRHEALLRIVWRDLSGIASVTETLAELSAVADGAICAAIKWVQRDLEARYGRPMGPDGESAEIVVLGMGKLGGRELNFSSDVDLIFCFTEHGETDGHRPTSNEEFFRKLTQRVVNALSRKTSDGFVYRVDIRLRPFGDSGPVAVSLAALESYLAQHGRDWERYAYVKARVINDWAGTQDFYDQVLRPFVYRRYLDYGVFKSLREMKAMIEVEVERKEFQNNVKLGRGGIREIEFIVQTLQLVRGGMNPDMRERELMPSLSKLIRPDCLTREESATLLEAYEFLRRFENRLQAISDRQTHDVPADDLNRARLCLAMDANDWESLAEELAGYRDLVANQFRHTLFVSEAPEEEAESDAVSQAFSAGVSDDQFIDVLNDLGFADSDAALERLNSFRESGFYLRLDESGRQRLNTLMPAVVSAAAHEPDALTALTGMLTIIEAIGRRSAYFALLSENPGALKRLVNLCAMSKLFVTRVAAHPLLLDELIDPRVFSVPPTREDFAEDLDERLAAATLHDAEASRFALRDFQQAATFRVAVTDLSGMLPLMKVSDRLTDVAELVLDGALRLARHEMFAKYGRPMCTVDGETREARFAIVAYGKLGGLELGYGSDLDLVFLHDSEGGDQFTDRDKPIDNNVFFARFAQRIIHILTMSTSTGPLYEVDMRLRPNGKAGLLVTSLQAFHRYQQKEAWTWEHQALLRGRSVAGDAELISAFEAVRQSVLSQNINYDTLKKDVADMREKMRGQLDKSTDALFDLKQGVGGITDIEFTVQYLVLAEAHNAPELTEFSDNIRQLEALAAAKIMPAEEAGFLTDAYREYRSQLHLQSLADQPRLVDRAQTAELAGKVHAVWQRVFA